MVHIFVTLHSVSLAATCLPVHENCGVEADKNLFYQEISSSTTEHTLLCAAFIENLIKLKALYMTLLVHDSKCANYIKLNSNPYCDE